MKGKGDKQGIVLCWRGGSRVRAKRTNGVNWRVKMSEIEIRRDGDSKGAEDKFIEELNPGWGRWQ